jgi:hypothetical protein
MNYGEEYALWYLRLNGFFPISNFVIHKSRDIDHSSDCDVLAIRPPYVFEEIGGREDDWDDWLRDRFDFTKTVGIICEVKTGDYDKKRLFRKSNVQYCIGRLGFVSQQHLGEVSDQLNGRRIIDLNSNHQLGKLLIANDGSETDHYFYLNLGSVISFLERRIDKYPAEKYRDRIFFSSILFQSVIDRIALKRNSKDRKEGA